MKANAKFIIVEFLSKEELVQKGNIFIPDRAIENSKLARGKVMSVGKKCVLGIEPGQVVLYDKHAINKYDDTIGAIAEDNVILVEK